MMGVNGGLGRISGSLGVSSENGGRGVAWVGGIRWV